MSDVSAEPIDPNAFIGGVEDDYSVTMDPGVRDMWCEALASGQYAQGIGVLRTQSNRFCPLGVLTDLAVQEDVVVWDSLFDMKRPLYICQGFTNNLAPAVRVWAGIKGAHPSEQIMLQWAGSWHPLWRINDHYRLPFDVQAHLISLQY